MLDYRIKLVVLGGTALLCALGIAWAIWGIIAAPQDDPNDNAEALIPMTDNQVRFVATLLALLFAVGLIWAVSRIRVHLRSKPDLAVPPGH